MVYQDFFQDNPFNLQSLENDPLGQRAIFEQARPGQFNTRSQQQVFSSLFDNVLNNFLREVGTSFKQGQAPPRTFTEFVNQQDFGRQLRRDGIGGGNSSRGLTSTAQFLFDR